MHKSISVLFKTMALWLEGILTILQANTVPYEDSKEMRALQAKQFQIEKNLQNAVTDLYEIADHFKQKDFS